MILVRDVFQAKYGRGDALIALLKDIPVDFPYTMRIFTDASGPFFTVVTEYEVESLAAWERQSPEVFSQPDFGLWFERMIPLVESGRREFYHIVG